MSRMTEEEVAAHNLRVRSREKIATPTLPTRNQKQAMIGRTSRGTMNKLEARYAREVLDIRKLAGEIQDYWYEAMKFRLADGAFYTPDFMVQVKSTFDLFEFHETKGFLRESANLRIKVAASLYPFRFVMIRRVKGEWVYQEF